MELHFQLEIEDKWPPVSVEGLPCTPLEDGFRVEAPPLFIKNLSVGDIISVSQGTEGNILSWSHLTKSGRTTIWLLRIAKSVNMEVILQQLRSLGCNTVQLPQYGCYSVDVPAECAIQDVDACLTQLDQSCVAIAYPSFRHAEP